MARRTLVTVALLTILSGTTGVPTQPGGGSVAVFEEAPEQLSMTEWALARYQTAGLVLPPMTIEFSDGNQAECGGNPARTYFSDKPTVRICWSDRFILLHELAHVWVAANVSESRRAGFMALRDDVVEWSSRDVAWADRGTEHAANVVAWGLLEDPYPLWRTYPSDATSLHDAYVYLTGSEPLHDGGPIIDTANQGLFSTRTNQPLETGR